MKCVRIILITCLVYLANSVHSFKLNSKYYDELYRIFSENDMFEKNEEKTVQYVGRVSPSKKIQTMGQVGGIDTDIDGNIIVFQRGKRIWYYDSFIGNSFNNITYGPIPEDCLLLIDKKTLKIADSWGSDRFYMPHGLHIDYEGNVWLTDVGLHQVFKYDLEKSNEPELVLGTRFEFGSDETHFCKPTSVAVAESNGDVFIADGYCNSRIAQFDKFGTHIRDFVDNEKTLIIPHSISLLEDINLICTVSREEGRIVCFDVKTGKKKHEITHPDMATVYAIEYDPIKEVLHAVTGSNFGRTALGLTFDASEANFGKFVQEWKTNNKKDLVDAHDLAISPDGSELYVGQLHGQIDEFAYLTEEQ